MKPDPTNLLNILEISNPLIGFYDTPKKSLFEPFTAAKQCIFSCYQGWIKNINPANDQLFKSEVEKLEIACYSMIYGDEIEV